MVNVLSRVWPFGKLFNNFCGVRVHRRGIEYLFEIDALSFHGDSVFMIEIKNRRSPPLKELIQKFIDSSYVLNEWRSSIGFPLKKVYPFIYYRTKEEVKLSGVPNNKDGLTEEASFNSFSHTNEKSGFKDKSLIEQKARGASDGKLINQLFLEDVKKMDVEWENLVFYYLS